MSQSNILVLQFTKKKTENKGDSFFNVSTVFPSGMAKGQAPALWHAKFYVNAFVHVLWC